MKPLALLVGNDVVFLAQLARILSSHRLSFTSQILTSPEAYFNYLRDAENEAQLTLFQDEVGGCECQFLFEDALAFDNHSAKAVITNKGTEKSDYIMRYRSDDRIDAVIACNPIIPSTASLPLESRIERFGIEKLLSLDVLEQCSSLSHPKDIIRETLSALDTLHVQKKLVKKMDIAVFGAGKFGLGYASALLNAEMFTLKRFLRNIHIQSDHVAAAENKKDEQQEILDTLGIHARELVHFYDTPRDLLQETKPDIIAVFRGYHGIKYANTTRDEIFACEEVLAETAQKVDALMEIIAAYLATKEQKPLIFIESNPDALLYSAYQRHSIPPFLLSSVSADTLRTQGILSACIADAFKNNGMNIRAHNIDVPVVGRHGYHWPLLNFTRVKREGKEEELIKMLNLTQRGWTVLINDIRCATQDQGIKVMQASEKQNRDYYDSPLALALATTELSTFQARTSFSWYAFTTIDECSGFIQMPVKVNYQKPAIEESAYYRGIFHHMMKDLNADLKVGLEKQKNLAQQLNKYLPPLSIKTEASEL